jgi:hypothetical protein
VVPWLYRKVVAAFPAAPFPIDIEEVLDLDQSFEGTGGIESASTIAYLRYCRLDSDEVRVEWSGGQFARCRLPVREIPRETP